MTRPPLPEAVKRAVRQRCYFGCVVCGLPIFDYDHIVEYAHVQEHVAENITLLCPIHHRAKTNRRFNVAFIAEKNAKPFNATRDFSPGYDVGSNRTLDIMVGSNRELTEIQGPHSSGVVISVNSRSYLSFRQEDGWMSFSAIVTDQKGSIVLRIIDGQMIASTSVWDLNYVGSRFTMRAKRGSVILDMTLTNHTLIVHQGSFIDIRDGTGFIAKEECLIQLLNGHEQGRLSGNSSGGSGRASFALANQSVAPWSAIAR